MRPYVQIIFVLLIGLSSVQARSIQIANNYLDARMKAIEENKNYVLVFSKDKCAPCEHYIKDIKNNVNKLETKKSYILVEVDIDDFDGYGLMKYYKVKSLPTSIVFEPKGAEISRIEQGVSSIEFEKYLNAPETYQVKEQTSSALIVPEKKRIEKSTPSKASEKSIQDNTLASTAPPIEGSFYTIQLGVFSTTANADALKSRVDRISSHTSFIQKVNNNFKLFSGKFASKSEAEAYLNQLKGYGYNGFVKSKNSDTSL